MIGDNSNTDMAGAGKVGMIKIQKNHYGVEISNKGIAKPDLIVNNYSELINLISRG